MPPPSPLLFVAASTLVVVGLCVGEPLLIFCSAAVVHPHRAALVEPCLEPSLSSATSGNPSSPKLMEQHSETLEPLPLSNHHHRVLVSTSPSSPLLFIAASTLVVVGLCVGEPPLIFCSAAIVDPHRAALVEPCLKPPPSSATSGNPSSPKLMGVLAWAVCVC
ncbi:hypothetical protein V6N12_002644 [Hibiscus sabdariffa]|uniref:Secreted protein n=1 Tax=Hibiscus sabdariffa TaxID=183260 RepID=A0ABR2E9K7_9ROSI